MDHDVTLLEKELIAIAATIPTTLGGGNHGHAGLIVEPAKYLTKKNSSQSPPPFQQYSEEEIMAMQD
jgi:hypothetical protein